MMLSGTAQHAEWQSSVSRVERNALLRKLSLSAFPPHADNQVGSVALTISAHRHMQEFVGSLDLVEMTIFMAAKSKPEYLRRMEERNAAYLKEIERFRRANRVAVLAGGQAVWTRQPVLSEVTQSDEAGADRTLRSLAHASECIGCALVSCQRMKIVALHARSCLGRFTGGCPVCRQLFAICRWHAKDCQLESCPVYSCVSLRRQWREQRLQQQQDGLVDAAYMMSREE